MKRPQRWQSGHWPYRDFGYLHRNPNDPPELTLDFQGYNFWLNKLNQFNGDYIGAEMVKSFLVSSEIQAPVWTLRIEKAPARDVQQRQSLDELVYREAVRLAGSASLGTNSYLTVPITCASFRV